MNVTKRGSRDISGERDDDIVAELIIADEVRGLALIRSIADFLRRNRDARPADRVRSTDAGKQFATTVKALEKEIGRFEYREDQTHAACQAFVEMAKTLGGSAIGTKHPNSRSLIEAACIPRQIACFTQTTGKRQLRTKERGRRPPQPLVNAKPTAARPLTPASRATMPVMTPSTHSWQ